MVILILKGDIRYFRGIGLVDILWKTVPLLLNRHFTSEIHFHGILHGFRASRGMGTTALESKLPKYLMAMKELVLYDTFLNLQKAYAVLDGDRCLKILAVYKVESRALKIIWMYWGRLTMISRTRGYNNPPFKGY